jgi:two-component system OmpR family sensor kinase
MFRSIRWSLQLWHAGILLAALVSFGCAMYFGAKQLEFNRLDAELEGAARELSNTPPGPPPNDGRRGGARGDMDSRGGPDNRGGERFRGLFGARPSPEGDLDQNLLLVPVARTLRAVVMGNRGDRRAPFSDVPSDVLRRVGQDERDQPYFVVWASEGFVLRQSNPAIQVPPPELSGRPPEQWAKSNAPVVKQSRGDLREVIVPGPMETRVLVGRSTQRELEELHDLRLTLILSGLGVMGIGLVGGYLLSNRAIRPINAITRIARSISASNLSRRIDLKDTQSELGVLAQTLNDTFDRLDQSFSRQIQFTADASHELRTPLTVIHSHAELALSKPRSADEYKQTLETCLRASRRMKSLVESLLVLARADAGRLELHPAPFDLRPLAEECLLMAQPAADEKQITLSAELIDVTLDADRTRIAQLLTNLLGNAVRYNRAGGSVKLNVRCDNHQVFISVADTGVGIAESDQPHVFERFFRADKARSREAGGSGLGLAICQSIVAAHGGMITFISKLDEGTTFIVQLPVKAC